MATIRAGVRHGCRRRAFRETRDDRSRRVLGDVARHHQGPGQPPFPHRRRAHRHAAAAGLSLRSPRWCWACCRSPAARWQASPPSAWASASVHGITLGFGTALIGEAVDYSIYLFVQSEQQGADQQVWIRRFWPTDPPGRPDLRLRLCVAAAVRLSRPRATGPVCHCRPGRGRRRDAFRAAAPAAVETSASTTCRRIGAVLVALGRTRRRAALGGRAGVAGGLRHPGPEPFASVEPEHLVAEPGVAGRRRARHPAARRHGRARCALPGGGVRCEPGGRAAILRAGCRAAANASRSR